MHNTFRPQPLYRYMIAGAYLGTLHEIVIGGPKEITTLGYNARGEPELSWIGSPQKFDSYFQAVQSGNQKAA